MYWMISANSKMYDHASAFQKWGFIDWRQKARYNIGDYVFIYCTKPLGKVMYLTIVDKVLLTSKDITNDLEFWHDQHEYYKSLNGNFARLKLIAQADSPLLTLDCLLSNGLKAAPQGAIKVNSYLSNYILKNIDDYANNGLFPDSDIEDEYKEGNTCKVYVNKYERSSIARKKCIDAKGLKCYVCGFDFEKTYGEIGKDFIHVHHIIPINTIGKEYVIDYKKDLIPVCPNCHAMLHRKINGKYLNWEELSKIIKK